MINFKAVQWTDLIDLSVNGVCEPPLTLDFSDNELQNSLLTGEKINLPDFPSHSQGVEQAVKVSNRGFSIRVWLWSKAPAHTCKNFVPTIETSVFIKGLIYGTIWFHILKIKQLFVFPYLFVCCISIHIRKKSFFNIFSITAWIIAFQIRHR